jgi:hypothetical protein
MRSGVIATATLIRIIGGHQIFPFQYRYPENIKMQRIIKVVFIVILQLLLFNACSTNQSNGNIVDELNLGLIESNNVIGTANETIVEALRMKTNEFITKEKAKAWLPKAELTLKLSKDQFQYLEGLKNMLKDSANKGKTANEILSLKDENKQLLIGYSKYLETLLGVDPKISEQIGNEVKRLHQFLSQPFDSKKITSNYLLSAGRPETISIFSKLQNNVLRMANICLLFCLNQIGYVDGPGSYTSFEAIVGQNPQILKAGGELEITAGLGSFSRAKIPKIIIGDREIQLNEKGLGIYKFKTSKKIGQYSLPVKVEFIDEDGKSQERIFSVEYTLVEAIKKK